MPLYASGCSALQAQNNLFKLPFKEVKMFRFFIVCWLAVALQGCASGPSLEGQPYYNGPTISNSNVATVYFFREHHPIGRGVAQDISINEEVVGSLSSGGYFMVQLDPGVKKVRARRTQFLQGDLGDADFDIDVAPGRIYFFAQETSSVPYSDRREVSKVRKGGFNYIQYYFRWAVVPQNEAEMRMRFCRLNPAP